MHIGTQGQTTVVAQSFMTVICSEMAKLVMFALRCKFSSNVLVTLNKGELFYI